MVSSVSIHSGSRSSSITRRREYHSHGPLSSSRDVELLAATWGKTMVPWRCRHAIKMPSKRTRASRLPVDKGRKDATVILNFEFQLGIGIFFMETRGLARPLIGYIKGTTKPLHGAVASRNCVLAIQRIPLLTAHQKFGDSTVPHGTRGTFLSSNSIHTVCANCCGASQVL